MIKCIFYSEFDNNAGPKIVYQVPENFLTEETFDAISEYIITKSSLCGRIIGLKVGELWILGRPMCLSHGKYVRNALLYNLGFVVQVREERTEREPLLLETFEEVLTKLSNYLATLEIESEFLSRHRQHREALQTESPTLGAATRQGLGTTLSETGRTPGENATQEAQLSALSKLLMNSANTSHFFALSLSRERRQTAVPSLPTLLSTLLTELNTQAQACIPVDDANTIHVRLIAKFPDPPEILDHQVPVIIKDIQALINPEWDLAIQRILPFVDGVNYVKRIAVCADMDIELVKKALQHLVYYGCVVMISDIFQMTNQYTATKDIVQLYRNVSMQRACLNMIRQPASAVLSSVSTSNASQGNHNVAVPPLTIGLVLRWYSELRPGYALSAFVRDHGAALSAHRINVRAFITFGLANRLIRRLHKYPLTLNSSYQSTIFTGGNSLAPDSNLSSNAPNSSSNSSSVTMTSNNATSSHSSRLSATIPNIQQLIDGKHSYDEICCTLGVSYNTIDPHFDHCIYR
jgi:hypothetical protein